MGSRKGFKYSYCFRVDDGIFSRYGIEDDFTRFIFETRTNFIVKGKFDDDDDIVDEKIIETERYGTVLWEYHDQEYYHDNLKACLGRRLKDYWMSTDEIHELVHKALSFADQGAADPQHASRPVIPIVVDLEVCTVQQEGEPISATIDRAIRAQYLYPIHLCPIYQCSRPMELNEEHHHEEARKIPELSDFLRNKLSTRRVEDVDYSMEECPICLRSPTVGAQISSLDCGHAFHCHCIVRWLKDNTSCPMCRQQICYDLSI